MEIDRTGQAFRRPVAIVSCGEDVRGIKILSLTMSVATPTPFGGRWNGSSARAMSVVLFNQQVGEINLTDLACAAFSSGEALGSKCRAAEPAFLLSSSMTRSASSPVTELLGSWAASTAPWDLSSFFSLSELMVEISRPWSELLQIVVGMWKENGGDATKRSEQGNLSITCATRSRSQAKEVNWIGEGVRRVARPQSCLMAGGRLQ